MRRALPLLLGAALLAACTAAPRPEIAAQRATRAGIELPAMKTFGSFTPAPPRRSNAAIARDFLDLSFRMESGRRLDRMTRFTGPVRVSIRGPAPPSLGPDLDRLLGRLRREAGIDIHRAADDAEAGITVQALPRTALHRAVPAAACFVVPNVADWQAYLAARRSERVDWAAIPERRRAAIFLPGDVSPQEARDCLHEELAQALGPLNDLYRLPDSVFNDDNFRSILTGFDMLILRAYYAPELANGMGRAQVAAALPGLLARLNPRGAGKADPGPATPTPPAWRDAMERAVGPDAPARARRAAAGRAVRIARRSGIGGIRLAFSLFAYGRLSLAASPETALAAFLEAAELYAAVPGAEIQEANVAAHLAAFALAAGQPGDALELLDEYRPAVEAAENAALLATMLTLRADALSRLGRGTEARKAAREGLAWARYGFGTGVAMRERMAGVAALDRATAPGKEDTS